MRKKIFGLIFILFLMVFCVPIFSGCKGCNSEREKFSIVFLVDDKEYVAITTAGKEQIILPLNPVKTDYVFDGWYFDKEFKNEVGSDSFVKKYLTKDVFVYSKWVAASGGAYTLTQISTNFTGQKLSQVLLDCDEHKDCSLGWQKPNSVLTTARANYFVNHTKDGVTTTQAVEVEAVARLDSNYCFQDMLFTLNNSKQTASVKSNSDSIVSVIIPEKVIYNETIYVVDKMEYHAFYDIDTLKYVYVPASIKIYNGSAFAHNKNLQTAEFDKDLTVLGVQMFMYCSNLQNINIPQGVTTIPTGFLYSCSKITNITLPNGITKIDSTAFFGTSLTSINLPSGLLEIGANAFASTDLERVEIPASVSFIDDKAFSGASMLKEVVVLSKNIEIGLEAFTSCRELRTVYINSAALVNSITTDTQDTHKLIYNMQNGDTLYISKDITLTSPYITSLFTKVDCSVVGYNAYKLGKYSKLSVQNFVNRVYVKGAGLYGDETIKILAPDNTWQTITLDKSMMEFFDTSTVGKKLAKITYKFNVVNCEYYVLSSINSKELNCISRVDNFYPTYYVGESLNYSSIKLVYCCNENGYMTNISTSVTSSMVSNFNTATTGTRIATFTKNGSSYKLRYYVKANSNATITSQSFTKGVYYAQDTTEETTHFIIKIKKGSYISADYKTIIEKIFAAEEKVSGLKFDTKITIDVNDTNYPSCGGLELDLTPTDLLFDGSSAFAHELAHALDYSQFGKFLTTSVLTEGFATYVEYLTAKELYLNDPVAYAYSGTMADVLDDVRAFGSQIYLYDFENRLLDLGRDEIKLNSQYEVGAKLFAYLDYKYGDFCSWMKSSSYKTKNLDIWKSNIKAFYKDSNLFDDVYNYYQMSGDKYNNFLGVDYNSNLIVDLDLTAINKFNYYFDFNSSINFQGYADILYKDLYINIESAREQLQKVGVQYNDLYLKAANDFVVQLYNSSGKLIQTVSKTTSKFSLQGVSYIKLVGTGSTILYLTYE